MGSDSDIFMFDVTNGIHSLHGIDFVFEIIPKVIPLDVQDFVVIEGGHKQITGNKQSSFSPNLPHTQCPSHPSFVLLAQPLQSLQHPWTLCLGSPLK